MGKVRNKILSAVLAAALLLGVFSFTPELAFAESQPWAADAVNALNVIYGAGNFSTENTVVTVGSFKGLLTSEFGYDVNDAIIIALGSDENLTRVKMAQAVVALYGFPQDTSAGAFTDSSDPAVVTLRSLGIVSGIGNNNFGPDGTVTNAELAVIFYRALGKAGAVGAVALDNIKPGEYGYDEIMYLFTRGCVPKDIDPTAVTSEAAIGIKNGLTTTTYQGKEAIWNAWGARLGSLPPGRGRSVIWTGNGTGEVTSASAITILDAAMLIVAEDRASLNNAALNGIFSDVNPGDWFYDGVMYLFNNGIVVGYGDGRFEPHGVLTRGQLAILLCRLNKTDITSPAGVTINDMPGHYAYNAATHMIDSGYMTLDGGGNFNPDALITRQEAVSAIFKSYNGYAENDVNLAVLDRFTDSGEIGEEYKTAMAYLVSAGVLKGGADGRMMPGATMNRAEVSVFMVRVMKGLDISKMYDYKNAVDAAKGVQ